MNNQKRTILLPKLSFIAACALIILGLYFAFATESASAISHVKFESTKGGNTKITWEYNSEESYSDGYVEIYRATDEGHLKLLKTKHFSYLDEDSYTDTTAKVGKEYTYYLDCYIEDYLEDEMVNSSYATKTYTQTTAKPDLSVKCVSSKTLKLKWSKLENAKGYKIYRATSKNGKYKLIKTIKGKNKTSYTNKSLKTGKRYYYKVAGYYYKDGEKTTGKKSGWKSGKATKNEYVTSPSYDFDYYGGPILRLKKLSYSHGKLKAKLLVLNDRMFYADYFKWVRIKVYDGEGRLIANQKFRNKSIDLDPYDYKYMTFTFDKGTKKKVNLRDGSFDIGYQYNYYYNY